MNYAFQEQEARHQKLRQIGKPVDYAGESFEFFNLRPFMERALASIDCFGEQLRGAKPRALEYGTGTGPGACFLAARGFEVDAIDICPTAIESARKFAVELGLAINYQVQDICSFRSAPAFYDVIVDNYCLHRLVTDARRSQAFAVVRSALKPTGYYILGSTTYQSGHSFGDDEYDAATAIVYRRLPAEEAHRYDDAVQRPGGAFIPRQRRPSPEALNAELRREGFQILRQEGGELLCRIFRPGE